MCNIETSIKANSIDSTPVPTRVSSFFAVCLFEVDKGLSRLALLAIPNVVAGRVDSALDLSMNQCLKVNEPYGLRYAYSSTPQPRVTLLPSIDCRVSVENPVRPLIWRGEHVFLFSTGTTYMFLTESRFGAMAFTTSWSTVINNAMEYLKLSRRYD